MNTRRTSLKVTVVATVISGAVFATPAGPASAYAGSCVGPVGAQNILQVREFSMQDAGGGSSLATVAADAAMSQEDAQLFVDNPGGGADFLLFGEDSGSDQLLTQFKPERYWVSAAGLSMRGAVAVPDSVLNEDGLQGFPPRPGPDYFENDRNEFYVDIRMGDVRTGGAHRVETCRLRLPR